MQRFLRTAVTCALTVTSLAGFTLMPRVARAQESGSALSASPYATSPDEVPLGQTVWNVSIGAGTALRPTYEGSNRYQVSPVPYANITYDDVISLGAGGLSAFWHHGGLRIGGGLPVEGGRKDYRTNGIFSEGDDRLSGLGTIDTAVGLRAFVTDDFGFMVLSGSVTKLTRNTNNGVLVDIGASFPYEIADRLIVSPRLTATLANRNYMQVHFGVTPAQATDSGFPEFAANSGVDDVSAGISAIYLFRGHWRVIADASLEELTGDASKSPVTFSSTDVHFTAIAAYHF